MKEYLTERTKQNNIDESITELSQIDALAMSQSDEAIVELTMLAYDLMGENIELKDRVSKLEGVKNV